MSVDPLPDNQRQTFEVLLNRAITSGERPRRTAALGPRTWSAIDLVARAHPEASPTHIADAYDTFRAEHRCDD